MQFWLQVLSFLGMRVALGLFPADASAVLEVSVRVLGGIAPETPAPRRPGAQALGLTSGCGSPDGVTGGGRPVLAQRARPCPSAGHRHRASPEASPEGGTHLHRSHKAVPCLSQSHSGQRLRKPVDS